MRVAIEIVIVCSILISLHVKKLKIKKHTQLSVSYSPHRKEEERSFHSNHYNFCDLSRVSYNYGTVWVSCYLWVCFIWFKYKFAPAILLYFDCVYKLFMQSLYFVFTVNCTFMYFKKSDLLQWKLTFNVSKEYGLKYLKEWKKKYFD